MDLIDRQALLKQIDIDSDGEPGYYGDTWKFIDTIKNLPSATEHGTNLAEVGTGCSEFPNNSDAISRQQAIDAFYLYPNINWTTLDILKKINEMPTIRPKRGRWIGKYPVSSICSECGYLINDSKVKVFAFCPNCGAKMEATE